MGEYDTSQGVRDSRTGKHLAALVRFAARATAGVMLLLVAVITAGEASGGGLPTSLTGIEAVLMGALIAICVGLLLGYFLERIGGLLALLALAVFLAVDWIHRGEPPRGWVFPTMGAGAALFLLSWWLHRRTAVHSVP